MISLLHPMFQPYDEPRIAQAIDPSAVKDAIQDVNPKHLLEWFALLSGIAAGGMWLWKKGVKPIVANLWGILRIGTSMEKVLNRVDQLSATVALSEARTKLMIDNRVDVGVWEADEKGRCRFANRKMLEALGGGFELVAGDNWHGIIADEDRGRVDDEWHRAIETGTDFNLSYAWKRPRDGSRIPIRVLGRRIANGDQTLGWICEVTFIF